MEKKSKKQDIELAALMFLVGLLLFIYPVVKQVSSYYIDEEEYEDLAVQIMPSKASPAPVLPIPEKTEMPTEKPPVSEMPITITKPEDAGTAENNPKDVEELPSVSPIPYTVAPSSETEAEAKVSAPPTLVPTSAPTTSVTVSPTIKPSVPTTAAIQPSAGIDLEACLAQNKDFVAWLTIPGTKINYPVVRSDNTEYYLHHLFTGKESKLGCLFSLRSSDYRTPSKNIAIYGHHLSHSDAMFSTLIDYKDASYCASHSLIQLDSLYGVRKYRIFAVLNMDVNDWDASTSNYNSNQAFTDFVSRAKSLSFYETGVDVCSDAHIITLITCDRSYHGKEGRLIVMAVEQ